MTALPNTVGALAELRRLEARARPVIDILDERGILIQAPLDSDDSAGSLLVKILTAPRHELFDARHVFWGTLERIVNPASVPQKIAVPFVTGKTVAETCVAAAIVTAMIYKLPADYVRMVEGLTSPEVGVEIRRAYRDRELFKARKAFLEPAFRVSEAGPQTLRIWLAPDATAPGRAVEEHRARLRTTYDFQGARENTRHLNDVLIQATLTNYALRGHYVAEADLDDRTGLGGVRMPSHDDAESVFVHEMLWNDFLTGSRVV